MTAVRENQITLILGMKGSGKSTKARTIMQDQRRKIWIDPMFEHSDGVIVKSFGDLVQYVEPLRHNNYSVILRTTEDGEAEKLITLLTRGEPGESLLPGATVMIDELDRLCSPTSVPEGIRRLANYGRHFGVSVVGVSRRPKSIARDFTANADRIIIGKVQEPADLKYIEEFTNHAFVERAAQVENFQFVEWPDGEAKTETPEDVIPNVDTVPPSDDPKLPVEPDLGTSGQVSE